MKDIQYDPEEESAYECFECGTIIVSSDNPVTCPDCGAEMRNRRTALE
jgi:rubrerythrin